MKRLTVAPARRRCIAWTSREDEQVVAFHPDYGALLRKLPNRTYNALRQRARHLGLVRQRNVWSTKQVERLRQAFASKLRSRDIAKLFPDLKQTQVLAKARHLDLSLGRRLKDFDDPALSTIRARADQMNLNLRDLDERARSGQYFQKSVRKFRLRHVARAVAALDGQILIEWDNA